MILSIIFSLAMVAQDKPCQWEEYHVFPQLYNTMKAFRDDQDENGHYLGYWGTFVHESGEPMKQEDVIFRRVQICASHTSCPVKVMGGMAPSEFKFLMAVDEFVTSATPLPTPSRTPRKVSSKPASYPPGSSRQLVQVGLASPVWNEREAAHAELSRRGASAFDAVCAGMRSKDAEVAWRSWILMEEIRFGRW